MPFGLSDSRIQCGCFECDSVPVEHEEDDTALFGFKPATADF